MSNPFSISGAPKFTSVASIGALPAAISAAKAGEIVTLTNAGNPTVLTLDQPKPSPGICVVLPIDQQVNIQCTAKNLNTEIVGGTITNDFAGAGLYALALNSASHMAFRGNKLSLGSILVQGKEGATDWVVADALIEWPTSDFFQLGGCSRFRLQRIFGRNMLKGAKIKWFDDGRAPVDNVGAPSPQNSTNGWWDDTKHNDAAQVRSSASSSNSPVGGPSTAIPSTDFLIDDMDIHVLGAGVVNYDYNPYSDLGLPIMERGVIQNCNLLCQGNGAIAFKGNDLQAYNNTIGPHPTDPGASPNFLRLQRLNGGSRIRGGYNTLTGVGSFFDVPAGIDISGSPQGDADVVNPTPPGFGVNRLPWAPSVTRPAYSAYASPPVIITAPKFYWTSGGNPYDSNASSPPAPAVGAYLSAGIGGVMGMESSTGEWRWCIGGTPISGATGRVYQRQAGDIGVLTLETRRSNAYGPGPWKASTGVVVA